MVDGQEEARVSAEPPRIADGVRNIGGPLRFTNVEPLAGFAAEAARGGQQIKVWTKLALTSDEPLFHRLVENLANVINHMAQQAGIGVNLRRADTALLILKPDATAELWLDTAAVSIRCAVKRAIAAGTVVFEHDIADVTGMSFPCVTFGPADKVLCLFRGDWRFGFAFDMNPVGKLVLEGSPPHFRYPIASFATSTFTTRSTLQAVRQVAKRGLVPFAEIITAEFRIYYITAKQDSM